jgi:hypothetical protein
MNKVTLLLPDNITRTLGTSFASRTDEVDCTARNMLNACRATSFSFLDQIMSSIHTSSLIEQLFNLSPTNKLRQYFIIVFFESDSSSYDNRMDLELF